MANYQLIVNASNWPKKLQPSRQTHTHTHRTRAPGGGGTPQVTNAANGELLILGRIIDLSRLILGRIIDLSRLILVRAIF